MLLNTLKCFRYDDSSVFAGGMHTDDTKNVADAQGNVLINVNHPPDEDDIYLHTRLSEVVKPHQVTYVYMFCLNSNTSYEAFYIFSCFIFVQTAPSFKLLLSSFYW